MITPTFPRRPQRSQHGGVLFGPSLCDAGSVRMSVLHMWICVQHMEMKGEARHRNVASSGRYRSSTSGMTSPRERHPSPICVSSAILAWMVCGGWIRLETCIMAAVDELKVTSAT